MKTEASLDALRKRPHWSFSSINGLVEYCSLKWAFHRVYREEPLFTPAPLVFGGVFHDALSYVFSRRSMGLPVDEGECVELFADLFGKRVAESEPPVQFADGETTDSLIETGRRMLAAYLASVDPSERVLAVGAPFSVPLRDSGGTAPAAPLIGEIDMLVENAGREVVVDWKTAARRWPGARARTDLQPTCYLYARWFETGGDSAGFRFDVVTKTKEAVCETHYTTRTVDDFDRLVGMVVALERLVQAEAFIPRDGSWECKGCPYGLACQSWHHARTRRHVHFDLAA